ncbi:MAG: septal ring lytic transglycosylase RlpA family protein [Candidatus Latescibacteria bacterium]|nr:septal ring lytic transglycosylase RlpA family protein [Candidatus Latescibacterota bacterium]
MKTAEALIVLIVLASACTPSPRYTVGVSGKPGKQPAGGEGAAPASPPVKTDSYKPPRGTKIRGFASYYAEDFHGKKTSNGEVFDMNGLTAAHKTLPFNTWIEVTNLANGRKVIVRINDRGPFVEGRILDLSLGAAKELHMLDKGVQEVEIEILR